MRWTLNEQLWWLWQWWMRNLIVHDKRASRHDTTWAWLFVNKRKIIKFVASKCFQQNKNFHAFPTFNDNLHFLLFSWFLSKSTFFVHRGGLSLNFWYNVKKILGTNSPPTIQVPSPITENIEFITKFLFDRRGTTKNKRTCDTWKAPSLIQVKKNCWDDREWTWKRETERRHRRKIEENKRVALILRRVLIGLIVWASLLSIPLLFPWCCSLRRGP